MNKYCYYAIKKDDCLLLSAMSKKSGDKNLATFYRNAAEGFRRKAMSMTVFEGLEQMK